MIACIAFACMCQEVGDAWAFWHRGGCYRRGLNCATGYLCFSSYTCGIIIPRALATSGCLLQSNFNSVGGVFQRTLLCTTYVTSHCQSHGASLSKSRFLCSFQDPELRQAMRAYCQGMYPKIEAKSIGGAHTDNSTYFSRQSMPGAVSAEVLQLRKVWWLDLNANFPVSSLPFILHGYTHLIMGEGGVGRMVVYGQQSRVIGQLVEVKECLQSFCIPHLEAIHSEHHCLLSHDALSCIRGSSLTTVSRCGHNLSLMPFCQHNCYTFTLGEMLQQLEEASATCPLHLTAVSPAGRAAWRI